MLATKNRELVIRGFQAFYLLSLVYLFIGSRSIFYTDERYLFFYQSGIWAGRIALIFYILTTIPGIFRRFGVKHKLISILMIFRRYTGISMYLSAFIHYMLVRGVEALLKQNFELPPPLFELFGLLALFLATPMVLTSNDIAVRLLGKWWGRIHKLTYILIAFIFLHVALQRLSIWSVLIGITFAAQISSHIYGRFNT